VSCKLYEYHFPLYRGYILEAMCLIDGQSPRCSWDLNRIRRHVLSVNLSYIWYVLDIWLVSSEDRLAAVRQSWRYDHHCNVMKPSNTAKRAGLSISPDSIDASNWGIGAIAEQQNEAIEMLSVFFGTDDDQSSVRRN